MASKTDLRAYFKRKAAESGGPVAKTNSRSINDYPRS